MDSRLRNTKSTTTAVSMAAGVARAAGCIVVFMGDGETARSRLAQLETAKNISLT